ncbi:MAG: Uma2 family endonuclease [Lachnospiraceae bacterium]|nr:Uma2 family endonuclease [Lachnospiraceae bacterium]
MTTEEERIYTIEDYHALSDDGPRMELIDGKFYQMASPLTDHQLILVELTRIIGNYINKKGGSCKVIPGPFAVEFPKETKKKTGYFTEDSVVEPDISVICDPDKLTSRGCTGAPDWIIEIVSPGSASHDLIRKLGLYTEGGVRDYWIIDLPKQRILVYRRTKDGAYDLEIYGMQDRIKAVIYDDLVIDFSAIEL